uniref:Serine/threonine protein kinase n=1 Tax=Leptobrachium leishanense TaxID=445787 RepID=A0A8C5Q745_9ANUR
MAKFCDIFCCFPRRRSRKPSESRSVEYVTIHGISDISSDDIFEVNADIPLIEDTQIQNVPPTTGESQVTGTEQEEFPVPTEAPDIKKQRVLVIVIEMVKPLPEESQDGSESLIQKTVSEPEPKPEKIFQPSETPESDDPAEPLPCAVSSESSECDDPAETLPLSLQSQACACDVSAESSPTLAPSADYACGYAEGRSPEIYIPEEPVQDSSSDVEASSGPRSAISLQDFNLHKVLGRGGFGKVMLAEFKVTKELFAIKTIKLAEFSSLGIQSILTEREILTTISSVRHPFVTNLFASFHTNDRAYFAMEYAAGGDLRIRLKSLKSFPEPMARFYTACIVLGLEFLHQQKIIHRDLKLDNIVLDKEGFAKITDFGLGKIGIGFGDKTTGRCGNRIYMAPEMIARKPYTRDVDWWAVGVMLSKMLNIKDPFYVDNYGMQSDNIRFAFMVSPRRVSSSATDLTHSLLSRSPVTRLGSQKGAQDVKDHPFFTEINWNDLLAKKMQPPFTPCLSGPEDVRYFERTLTTESPSLTPPPDPGLGYHEESLADFDWVAE